METGRLDISVGIIETLVVHTVQVSNVSTEFLNVDKKKLTCAGVELENDLWYGAVILSYFLGCVTFAARQNILPLKGQLIKICCRIENSHILLLAVAKVAQCDFSIIPKQNYLL